MDKASMHDYDSATDSPYRYTRVFAEGLRIGSMHTSANYNVSVQSSERGSLGCKPL